MVGGLSVMRVRLSILLLLALTAGACERRSELTVGVAAARRELAEPVLRTYGSNAKTDVRIIDAVGAGDADVLWERDPLRPLRLARAGKLAQLPVALTAAAPPGFVDPDGRWIAVVARARVIAYDRDKVSADDAPTSVLQLAEPKWAARLVLATPNDGSSALHAAALFAALGTERGVSFYRALRDGGALLVASDEAARDALIAGERAVALLDSDLALAAQEGAPRIEVFVPDQSGLGAVLLPDIVAIAAAARNGRAAQELLESLLSPPVAQHIALSGDLVALRGGPGGAGGMLALADMRAMPIAYPALLVQYPAVQIALREAGVVP